MTSVFIKDFPGGPVVKNPLCNAGDMGSTPGQGTKIPHALEQLSPHATTTEPVHHNQGVHGPWWKPPHDTMKIHVLQQRLNAVK